MSSMAGGAGTSSDGTVWNTGMVCSEVAAGSAAGAAGIGGRTASLAGGTDRASGWTTLFEGAARQPTATTMHPAQRISLWTGDITPSFTKHGRLDRQVSEVGNRKKQRWKRSSFASAWAECSL